MMPPLQFRVSVARWFAALVAFVMVLFVVTMCLGCEPDDPWAPCDWTECPDWTECIEELAPAPGDCGTVIMRAHCVPLDGTDTDTGGAQ